MNPNVLWLTEPLDQYGKIVIMFMNTCGGARVNGSLDGDLEKVRVIRLLSADNSVNKQHEMRVLTQVRNVDYC